MYLLHVHCKNWRIQIVLLIVLYCILFIEKQESD